MEADNDYTLKRRGSYMASSDCYKMQRLYFQIGLLQKSIKHYEERLECLRLGYFLTPEGEKEKIVTEKLRREFIRDYKKLIQKRRNDLAWESMMLAKMLFNYE